MADSSHQARRLGTFEQILAATPSVAARIPAGLTPADAVKLPWIANGDLKNTLRWTFSRGQTEAVTERLHKEVLSKLPGILRIHSSFSIRNVLVTRSKRP